MKTVIHMIDIHCHILPRVDDGAGSFADSVEMATLAASSGIRTIVVTPHSNIPNTFENYWTMEMQSVFDRLQKQVNDKKIPVTFLRGQEIFLTSDYMTLIKQGKLISINHSRYFLVEFDPYENASVVLRKLQKILAEGYVPIVAHPERYSFVHEHADMI